MIENATETKKIGRFILDFYFLDSEIGRSMIRECFYQLSIIPVRAEALYDRRAIEYIAISPFFDETKPGYIPLNYQIIMNDGKYRVEKI